MQNFLRLGKPFTTDINQIRSEKMYTFGVGTIGGPFVWQAGQGGRPVLSPELRGKVRVLPSGSTSRQEMRYLVDEAERSGQPYVEAPKEYVRGYSREKTKTTKYDPEAFYDPQTGEKFSGTMMWIGGGWKGHTAHGKSGQIETSEGSYPWGQQRGGYGSDPFDQPERVKTKGGWMNVKKHTSRGSFY